MLILFAGNKDFARAELEQLGKAYKCPVHFSPDYAILKCSPERAKEIAKRLCFSKIAGEVISNGKFNNLDDLERVMQDPFFNEDHTGFGVEVWKIGKAKIPSQDIKARFGSLIKGKPNLSKPREIFDLVLDWKRNEIWITRRVWRYDPKVFSSRHPMKRPVFHPTSLKPKLARFLVNLSGLVEGQTLLDPFCGVGGILIEAGILGIRPTGIELDPRWAEGANKNLRHYGITGEIINSNFLEWKGGSYDGIVTDLPYGRSSKLALGTKSPVEGKAGSQAGSEAKGKAKGQTEKGINKLDQFYLAAFKKMKAHSEKAVIVGPKDMRALLNEAGWGIELEATLYIHKNLSRWIYLCKL